MRTTIDIPDELLSRAKAVCKERSKKNLICRALESYIHSQALEDLRTMRGKIEFDVMPDELEELEIRAQHKRDKILGRRR